MAHLSHIDFDYLNMRLAVTDNHNKENAPILPNPSQSKPQLAPRPATDAPQPNREFSGRAIQQAPNPSAPAPAEIISPPSTQPQGEDGKKEKTLIMNVTARYKTYETPKVTSVKGKACKVRGQQCEDTSKFSVTISSDRHAVLGQLLTIHGVNRDFVINAEGPPFKVWWAGSLGGKSGAATINNDKDWNLTYTEMMDKRNLTTAMALFDLEKFDQWKNKKRAYLPDSQPEVGPSQLSQVSTADSQEDSISAKKPKVDDFESIIQEYGKIAQELQAKWQCNRCRQACYITPRGNHFLLSNYRQKIWCQAIDSGETTVAIPPNHKAFDAARDDNQPSGVMKTRARAVQQAPTVTVNMAQDPTLAAFLTALTPLLNVVTQQFTQGNAPPPVNPPPAMLPATPTMVVVPNIAQPHPRTPQINLPMQRRSPAPSPGPPPPPPINPDFLPLRFSSSPIPPDHQVIQVTLEEFGQTHGMDVQNLIPLFNHYQLRPPAIVQLSDYQLMEFAELSELEVVSMKSYYAEYLATVQWKEWIKKTIDYKASKRASAAS